MSPKVSVSCWYLEGKIWTKLKWLTSFQGLRLSLSIWIMAVLVRWGHFEARLFMPRGHWEFKLSIKAHFSSESILCHSRGYSLRLAQWGLSHPAVGDPSAGTLSKEVRMETDGKFSELGHYGHRGQKQTSRQILIVAGYSHVKVSQCFNHYTLA